MWSDKNPARIATDTCGTPRNELVFIEKTSGSKSKPTRPSNNPADSPKTRWNRSFDFSATNPPKVVAKTVIAANAIAMFIAEGYRYYS